LLPSNEKQIDLAYDMIEQIGSRKVGVLGFSFKEGTDDLRESPMVELIEKLIGRGYQVQVHDKHVSLANLQGANRVYIEATIPHISSLMVEDVEEILTASDVIIVGNKAPEYKDVYGRLRDDQTMIDLVRIVSGKSSTSQYQGIAW
jgi:GDP-mannose 6-dehydrogenase